MSRRRCATCKGPISRYNPNDACYACLVADADRRVAEVQVHREAAESERMILDALGSMAMTTKDVALLLERDRRQAHRLLVRLLEQGVVERLPQRDADHSIRYRLAETREAA